MQEILIKFISLLPGSPFTAFINSIPSIPYLGYINYFVPISQMIAIGQAWLTAIGIFYLYQAVLRWLKAIE